MYSKIVSLAARPIPLPFPKLMKGAKTDAIYLMTNPNAGTVIYSGIAGPPIGTWANDWQSRFMEDFVGTLQLGNGEE